MAMYATPSELASYLQQDLDTATAELALSVASEMFSKRARTWFTPTSATYTTTNAGLTTIELPLRPVTAVTAVRVNGVALAVGVDYTLRRNTVYRADGFGDPWASPPDLIEVDYTHGLASVPDDVKGAVLETAALVYMNPTGVSQESVDDYSVRYAGSGGALSPLAERLAGYYRGILVA